MDERSKAPRTLKRIKRTRDSKFGVYNTKLIHAHEAWDRLRKMDADMEELAIDMANSRIIWKDPRAAMEGVSTVYPVVLSTLPETVPPILVHADRTPDFTVTLGIYRYIESLTTSMIHWDKTPPPATLDWRVMKSIISAISPTSPTHGEPLLFASCGRPATLTNTCILIDQILASSFLDALWPLYHSTRYRHVLS